MATGSVSSPAVRLLLDADARPTWNFAFSDFLKREHRFGLDPDRPACKAFMQGHCPQGDRCPDKHYSNYNNLVCKHWLRGLCKKGDTCEYLHEYNLRAMPECTHYSRHLTCANGSDCLYLHIDPAMKEPPCPHYERGFCPLGPNCAARHVKRQTYCRYYLAGFCPNGRGCKEGAHPPWHETDDMKKPQVRVVMSEEEKAEQHRQKAEKEREDEIRDDQDRAGLQAIPSQAPLQQTIPARERESQPGRSGGGRGGRGRKNWSRQRRERY